VIVEGLNVIVFGVANVKKEEVSQGRVSSLSFYCEGSLEEERKQI